MLNANDLVQTLTVEDVVQVYSGKANTCCCGCAGRYWDREDAHTLLEEKKWARQAKRVLKLVQENFDELRGMLNLDMPSYFASVDIGARMYTVYITDSARARLQSLAK
jgi:hypothetical protein